MKVEIPPYTVKLNSLNKGDIFTYDNRVYMVLEFKYDSFGSFCECWNFTNNDFCDLDCRKIVIPWPNATLKLQGD